MNLLQHVVDVAKGTVPLGMPRSGKWPAARAAHLKDHPCCAVCGSSEKVEVHHIHPFHLHPDLELDPTNFVSLCESDKAGVNCHLHYGHLGNFKSFNVDVVADAALWFDKIYHRPDGEAAC